MKQNDNEALQLFIEESREHLGGIEEDLLVIEKGGANAPEQVIDKVFRAVHTLKGSASFFGFAKIKNLSHAMESVLGKIRSRELVPTSELVTVLLDGADALRSMVNDIDNSDTTDIVSFVSKLDSFLKPSSHGKTSQNDEPKPEDVPSTESVWFQFSTTSTGVLYEVDLARIFAIQQVSRERFIFLLEIDTENDTLAKNRSVEEILDEIKLIVSIISLKKTSTEQSPKMNIQVLCASSLDKDILVDCFVLPKERISQVLAGMIHNVNGVYSLPNGLSDNLVACAPPNILPEYYSDISTPSPVPEDTPPLEQTQEKRVVNVAQETSLRVSINTLDKLMTLAGEMVLTRNELLQNTSAKNMQKILAASQRVDSITSELQEAIMSTRMQSIGVVLNKFRRLVRDLSGQLGKQIQLEIEGEEVELDKSIIEAVADPLTHIVRNAVDHGIESPAVRQTLGKTAHGTLKIKASHEAGHVVIQIIDDGKGIDPDVIRKKVRNLAMVDESTLASMSDREVIKFIFKAGFSTAEKVTDVSGRGVGMDVVQNNLKKVGGAVDIDSIAGKGTVLRIKLPLTLAIIPSLLVIVEGERYAIPQTNLLELVRISAADVKRRMEMVGGAAVLRLRGELLPLIRVSDVLGATKFYIDTTSGENQMDRRKSIVDRRGDTEPDCFDDKRRRKVDRRKSHLSAVNVAIVVAGDFKYGLIVDSLLDSSEIVVKPLGYHLRDCREYAGATILGDGQVALILDVVGIRRLLEMKENLDAVSQRMASQFSAATHERDRQSFLIVENGEGEFFAIPVGLIARIEKIKEHIITNAGGKQASQYRGGTLRLFSIEDVANVKPRGKKTNAYIVLFHIGGRETGIVVSGIIDTVDISAADIDELTHVQSGIIGSVVVHDSITLILDIFGIVKTCAPELCGSVLDQKATGVGGCILIVEDSVFFLHQIRSFIEDAGYETICAEDGIKGLAILKNSDKKIDIVLTDIEMPNMNGLEMTRAIRADQALKDIPIIAVTSVTGEKAERLGREAGIDEYLIKLERDAVLAACSRFLGKQTKQELTKELV